MGRILIPPELWADISHLHARFAWGVDSGQPALAAAQFIEHGRLIVPGDLDFDAPPLIYEGRSAIQERWEQRTAISRHVFVNLWLEEQAPGTLNGKILMIGYRSNKPGTGNTIPAVISDFDDIIVRDSDGTWRFAERRATIVFVGAPE